MCELLYLQKSIIAIHLCHLNACLCSLFRNVKSIASFNLPEVTDIVFFMTHCSVKNLSNEIFPEDNSHALLGYFVCPCLARDVFLYLFVY